MQFINKRKPSLGGVTKVLGWEGTVKEWSTFRRWRPQSGQTPPSFRCCGLITKRASCSRSNKRRKYVENNKRSFTQTRCKRSVKFRSISVQLPSSSSRCPDTSCMRRKELERYTSIGVPAFSHFLSAEARRKSAADEPKTLLPLCPWEKPRS